MTAGLMLGISVEQPGMCMRALFQVDADGLAAGEYSTELFTGCVDVTHREQVQLAIGNQAT